VPYSVGNVRMGKSLSEDTMIRQGIVNRQAFVCTFNSILVGGRTNFLRPIFHRNLISGRTKVRRRANSTGIYKGRLTSIDRGVQ
jgi:hypothetical protein